MRHTLLGRLLLTGVAAAFGLIYVPSATVGLSVMRSGESVDTVSFHVEHSDLTAPQARSVAPDADTNLGNNGPAVNAAAYQHQHVSGHHHMSEQPTRKNPERRQALAALAALLIQIQSAGTGGR